MKVLTPSLILALAFPLLTLTPLEAQSMIDMAKEDVRVMVKEKHKEFRPDQTVVNQRFNYLKYGICKS